MYHLRYHRCHVSASKASEAVASETLRLEVLALTMASVLDFGSHCQTSVAWASMPDYAVGVAALVRSLEVMAAVARVSMAASARAPRHPKPNILACPSKAL